MSAAPIVGDASAAWDPSVFHSAVVPGEVTPRHWLVAVVTILAYCLIELVLPALVTADRPRCPGSRCCHASRTRPTPASHRDATGRRDRRHSQPRRSSGPSPPDGSPRCGRHEPTARRTLRWPCPCRGRGGYCAP